MNLDIPQDRYKLTIGQVYEQDLGVGHKTQNYAKETEIWKVFLVSVIAPDKPMLHFRIASEALNYSSASIYLTHISPSGGARVRVGGFGSCFLAIVPVIFDSD